MIPRRPNQADFLAWAGGRNIGKTAQDPIVLTETEFRNISGNRIFRADLLRGLPVIGGLYVMGTLMGYWIAVEVPDV